MYLSSHATHSFYYTSRLEETVSWMESGLGPHVSLLVYPDATLKVNLLPTGVIYFAKPEHMLLMPALLRDPGCGFLSFNIKLTQSPTHDHTIELCRLLDELGNKRQAKIQPVNLDDILYAPFPVDKQVVKLTAHEIDVLQNDFMKLTNTIEIKKYHEVMNSELLNTHHIHQDNLFGFIHSGCYQFPQLLEKRFVTRICDFAYENKLFTLEQIRNAIVAVPAQSPLGIEYQQWINAAMNYAIASRHALYQEVKCLLEQQWHCKVTLLNDNLHAGSFCSGDTACCARGVQNIAPGTLTLLAGQRETISILMTGGPRCQDFHHKIAHGTGYLIHDNYDYSQHFSEADIKSYQQMAKDAVYNTTPIFAECLPLTFNLLSSMRDFEMLGLAERVAILSPVVNVQSDSLPQNKMLPKQ